MDWSHTLAIIAATVVGPIAAVCISFWMQHNAQVRERKTVLLRHLVGTRNLRASPEYGIAISLIPVEFKSNSAVIAARNTLLQKVNDGTPEDSAKIAEIDNLLSDLVGEMLKDLGFKVLHSDIRGLHYTPNIVGWRDNLYIDSLLAQLHTANALAKTAHSSRKIAENAGAVEPEDEASLPYPSLERRPPQD
ncbi:MAG: DUF6680 family protein [Hyphomonas sp.]